MNRKMTLPTDSATRKEYPILSGFLKYFPAAIAGVAKVSKLGNDKHNPGEALHHARGKSMDHGDCILRHLMDVQDLLTCKASTPEAILLEVNQMVWRALAYSQEIHEKYGAPLAPAATVQPTAMTAASNMTPEQASEFKRKCIEAKEIYIHEINEMKNA